MDSEPTSSESHIDAEFKGSSDKTSKARDTRASRVRHKKPASECGSFLGCEQLVELATFAGSDTHTQGV